MLPSPLEDLLEPAAYGHPVTSVGLIQTHISYVFVAGEFAYKIKKPVRLGFVDYGTLERRHTMCEEEVRLNRRLCDGVYLGVVPITRDARGTRLAGSGEVIEYAVQMRRVPEERMMPGLLASGAFTDLNTRAVADKLASFHASASTDKAAIYGSPEAIATNWNENFKQTAPYVGRTIARRQYEGTRAYVARYLGERDALVRSRAQHRFVKDCHGDLRSDSIVVWEDGSVCFMDCIEFNERLRYGDVASEVAFLAMDLDFRGHRAIADAFVSAYMEHTSDETLTVVLNFYRAYRAYVRGKVESLLLDEAEVEAEQKLLARERAKSYFNLSKSYMSATGPGLVIMSGLSGSGKSWIASALAGRASAALVRSDHVRRELYGERVHQADFGESVYTEADRARVYASIFERAATYLDDGMSVVLDATFPTASLRKGARDLARARDAGFLAIETTAPEELIHARLTRRDAEPGVSDARWDTYVAQRAHFQAIEEMPAAAHLVLDSSQELDELVSRAVSRISGQR